MMLMGWIYLSPHLDDVALSCGGLVWEQAHAGQNVSVWTVCAGDPPPGSISPFASSLHERWETGHQAVEERRLEDLTSCARLGASARHFSIPDCIYRLSADGTPLYASEAALFGLIDPGEWGLVHSLSAELARILPAEVEVVCPLALGGHVDHRLTRAAAERLSRPLWYYSDYPYVLGAGLDLETLCQTGWKRTVFPVTETGRLAWEDSVAAYSSQISTFWSDNEVMRGALRDYCQISGGVILWQAPDI